MNLSVQGLRWMQKMGLLLSLGWLWSAFMEYPCIQSCDLRSGISGSQHLLQGIFICKYSAKTYTVLSPLSSLHHIASHIFHVISNINCSSILSSQYSLFSIFILLTLCFLPYNSANCSLSHSLLLFDFVHELCCIGPIRGFLPKYFLETALLNFTWLSKVRQIVAF